MWYLLLFLLSLFPNVVIAQSGPFSDPPLSLFDKGVFVGRIDGIDCGGIGITCTRSGNTGGIIISGGGGGSSIQINGVNVTDANFNDTLPLAVAGRVNLEFKNSGGTPDNISVQTPQSIPIVLSRQFREIVIANSIVETTLSSCVIPANSLSRTRSVQLRVVGAYINNTGVNQTIRVRIIFGGVIIYNDVTAGAATSVNERGFDLDMVLSNDPTGSNYIAGKIDIGGTGAATVGSGDLGSDEILATAMVSMPTLSSVDTTVDQPLDVTVQLSTATVGGSVRRDTMLCTLY